MHRALMPTRGAAVAVARIDAGARTVRYVGVGNISGVLVSDGGTRHMVSHNGTAGHVAPRIREFTYEFSGDPLVILHSDGLTPRWDLGAYPGLATQHPSLIAGVLLRDYRRGRDDASVVAMRAIAVGIRAMNARLLLVAIGDETDIVLVRKRTRRLAELIGFEGQDQTRITTAVSEIARNAFEYAGGGQIEFRLAGDTAPQRFVIIVSDRGPGIADLPAVLSGSHKSATGMGVGLLGAQRLMDEFDRRNQAGRGHHGAADQDAAAARAADHGIRPDGASTGDAGGGRSGRRDGGDPPAEPADPAADGTVDARVRRSWSGSTRNCRTPIAAWSRCTPNSTNAPIICAGPTS